LDLSNLRGKTLYDLIENKPFCKIDMDKVAFNINPFGYLWMQLRG